ncbi:nitroreductase [Cenarchaeum symbiosum A]|uniref:Nitroreductase n=1 Tax=Cenarchaeum symbiosum (strain A) TaxID=414004 RepID=A0RXW0_CENSY|nr:nitroreductase [Cenarchaeum symbiosum A]
MGPLYQGALLSFVCAQAPDAGRPPAHGDQVGRMDGGFTSDEKSGFYKAVYSRRDVRSGFTQRPVEAGVLGRILDAAHHAPSVGFSQPWNFILIKDEASRGKVRDSFYKERERSAALVDGERKSKYLSLKLEGILDSPVNVCVTYDPSKFGPFVIGRSAIPDTGVYSVCCAVQNLWLAARAEGVGVGWVSILSNDALREILGIPEGVLPVAYLCLGYVDEFATKPDLEAAGWLPRLGLPEVVYYERWGRGDAPGWEAVRDLMKSNLDTLK